MLPKFILKNTDEFSRIGRFLRKFPSLFYKYTAKNMPEQLNLKPPDKVAGLTTLDKKLFEKTMTVPCLTIETTKLAHIMPIIKKHLFKIVNFKPVRNVDNTLSEVYLNPDLPPPEINDTKIVDKEVILHYENYSLESILKAVLPPENDGFSSFTRVGHLVHVNLREHLHSYKDIIGQVLFDKVPHCKTVVNKSSSIDNTYRNFQMEVLRGEPNFLVQVKENKCIFELDFSKVYWNSRLCTEHERIVNLIPTGSVVFDVFAGVGPFAVPLAKKKCRVFANDLNPESYKWMVKNSTINKINEEYFKTFNKDGRDFILNEIRNLLPKFIKDKVYIIMNLPALAVDFLPNFIGLFNENELGEMQNPPTVIVYCFAKGEDYVGIAKNLLFEKIGFNVEHKILDIFRVRTVSNYKEMMRITLKLDEEILIKHHKRKHENPEDVNTKKHCSNGEEQKEDQQRV